MAMPLPAYVATFSEQLHFWRTHFYTLSTSSKQLVLQSNSSTQELLFPSSYFFRAVTFLEQQLFQISHFFPAVTFFQKSIFFRSKLLPSSYLLVIGCSLGQLLFWRTNLFRIKISIEELLFCSRYFYAASHFSE